MSLATCGLPTRRDENSSLRRLRDTRPGQPRGTPTHLWLHHNETCMSISELACRHGHSRLPALRSSKYGLSATSRKPAGPRDTTEISGYYVHGKYHIGTYRPAFTEQTVKHIGIRSGTGHAPHQHQHQLGNPELFLGGKFQGYLTIPNGFIRWLDTTT